MTPDEIAEQHVPLALKVASLFIRRMPGSVDADALRGAALEGLVKASRRYTPDRSTSFETYAITCIRGAMIDELRRLDPNTRSSHKDGTAEPTPFSLQQPVGGADSDAELGELIPGRRDTEAEALRRIEIRDAFRAMPVRDRSLVIRYLSGETLYEIGASIDRSESRVSQIVKRATERAELAAIGTHQYG